MVFEEEVPTSVLCGDDDDRSCFIYGVTLIGSWCYVRLNKFILIIMIVQSGERGTANMYFRI